MTRSLDKLPDFSKGESFATRQHPEFEPLFCQPVGEQIRIEESLIEPSMADTELGQLMSELDQLGCDVEEAAQVAEEALVGDLPRVGVQHDARLAVEPHLVAEQVPHGDRLVRTKDRILQTK